MIFVIIIIVISDCYYDCRYTLNHYAQILLHWQENMTWRALSLDT